ncbi:MAG: hypothetical protein K1X79_01565 [Oligoflexia bacterium]|nr:hypothetical protein [Oligoflexia bacterium]
MARRHAAFLSPIPSSVSLAVHALWNNHCNGKRTDGVLEIWPDSFTALRRVDRTAKLKTPIYFAAQTLFPDAFDSMQEDDTSDALLRILGPGLFATFLAMVYMQRRLNKVCEATEWETLSKELILNMELGYIAGQGIPKLTAALGTLLGGIRYAALATFLIRSPDIYSKYRNRMKKKFDFFYEHQQWGCDHSQISAFLVKELGFTKDIIEVAKVLRRSPSSGEALSPEMKTWHAGLCWIDGIKEGKIPPEEKEAVDTLKATSAEIAAVRSGTEKLFKEGATFTWMLRKLGGEEKAEGEEA